MVTKHNVSSELILNMDKTGMAVIPVSSWTMAEIGTKDGPILGIDNKRQITVVVTCSLIGKILSP